MNLNKKTKFKHKFRPQQKGGERGGDQWKQKQQHKKFNKTQQQPKQQHFGNKQDAKGKGGESSSLSSGQKQPLISHEGHGNWFEYQFDENRSADSAKPDEQLVQQAQMRAEELLKRDCELFTQWYRSRNRGDADWLDTVAQRGTFPDRLSALQLRVQRSPVHALPQLRQFVALVQRKGEKVRQAHSITKALRELFMTDLLPPQRKLLQFSQRPLEKWATVSGKEADRRLLMWQFESELKQCYRQFVEGLQTLAGNMVEGVALGACREMADLLSARPEQEQVLLSAVVNKLGHPLHRVGAGVAEYLQQNLVHRHPNMRLIVVREMEALMFRKNISPKAQRYALHFLSRMLLEAGESELALQLIRIYLRLFHILVAKDALDQYTKLLPLLITGLNRAFPYAKSHTSEVLQDVEPLYAIVQTAKFSTALSVLRLLFQIHSSSDGLSDRFYSAFYRRLLNLQPGSQHDAQLFTLTQQILKHDLVECRVRAFLKRFFQVALSANSAFAAATLLMCHTVVRERPQLLRLEGINTTKSDLPPERVLQRQKMRWFEKSAKDAEEDEEDEHYEDIESDKEKEEKKTVLQVEKQRNDKKTHGWIHRPAGGSAIAKEKGNANHIIRRKRKNGELSLAEKVKKEEEEEQGEKRPRFSDSSKKIDEKPKFVHPPKSGGIQSYDPTARNPLFAGAEWALDTELCSLARHYHPTVASFAQALIRGQPINYRGDPLVDLSQMRFLDRFAFKNPKTRHKQIADSSADNKSASAGPLFAHVYTPSGVKALNPTSQDYLSKKSSEIPLDERFLHHFATLKFKKDKKEKGKKGRMDDDQDDEVASLDSEEFDQLMERFEPGEQREVFDVDFSAEFGEEADTRSKRKALKRKRQLEGSDEDEEDENDEEEGLAGSDEDEEDDYDDEMAGSDDEDDFDEDEIDDEEEFDGEEFDEDEISGSDDDDEELGSDMDVADFDSEEGDDEEEEEELEFG